MTSLSSRWPSVEDEEMLRASSLGAEQETCTFRAALQLLGIKPDRFYHLLTQGQIRKVSIGTGRTARYVMADLKEVARQRQVLDQTTYSLDETMRRLGILQTRLHRYIKEGHIRRPVKGRYFKADVEALYEARHTSPRLPDHLCTTIEAAKLLLLQRNQVLLYVRRGVLHPERAEGEDYVFSRAEVLAFQQQRLQSRQESPPDTALYTALYSALLAPGVQYLVRHGFPWHEAEDMLQHDFLLLWERPGDFFVIAPDLKSQIRLMMGRLKQAQMTAGRSNATHARQLQALMLQDVSWCRPHVPSVEQQVIDRERIQDLMRLAEKRLPASAQAILRWSLMGYGAIEIEQMVHEQYGVSWTLSQTKAERARVLAHVRSWIVQERVDA